MKHLYRLQRYDNRFQLLSVDMGTADGHPKEVFVYDLLEDRSGFLWVAAASGLFQRWPDGRIEHYTKRDGLPDDVIHDLLEDHQGRLWAGTRLGGFFRFVSDGTRKSPLVAEVYNKQKGLPSDWVFQLFETSDHRFWIATNVGLVAFFPTGTARAVPHLHKKTRVKLSGSHGATKTRAGISGWARTPRER
jgi:ligand-binding sensor domain-containing protein